MNLLKSQMDDAYKAAQKSGDQTQFEAAEKVYYEKKAEVDVITKLVEKTEKKAADA